MVRGLALLLKFAVLGTVMLIHMALSSVLQNVVEIRRALAAEREARSTSGEEDEF